MQQLVAVSAFHKILLTLVVAGYLVLATTYSLVVPLGEGPDESGHMGYVLFLVRNGRLPDQLKGSAGEVPGEGHQPPLAYLLLTPAAEWLPGRTRRVILTANPDFVWNGGTSPAAFMRGSQEFWPWQGVPLAWHLARSVAVLLGALTLLCIWGMVRDLRPDWPALALGAVALAAFNPQFLFSNALVSNDPLLTLLSAALIWLCVYTLQKGSLPLRLPPAFALGFVFGLALITKQSALLLGPVALLTVLLDGVRRAGIGGSVSGVRALQSRSMQGGRAGLCEKYLTLVTTLALFGLTTLAVAGWWYLRNWRLYGDPLGLAVFKAEFSTEAFDWRDLTAWWGGLIQLHNSFWGYFGWTSLPQPGWVYGLIVLVELAAFVGLLRLLMQSPTADRQRRLVLLVGCLLPAALALAWTVSFAFTAGLVAWQGRFLFPALGAIVVGLAWGLLAWGRLALSAALLALALLALASPFTTIAPAYPWYTLSEQAALAQRGNETYARFADGDRMGVELHGWQLNPQPLRAGQQVTLTLTWYARTRIATPWTVFVHLVDSNDEIVFDSDRQPVGGAFPMTLWTPGDWVPDVRVLDLPRDLPPGRYTLRVGLFEQNTSRRAPYFNDDDMTNVEGDAFDLALVDVVP